MRRFDGRDVLLCQRLEAHQSIYWRRLSIVDTNSSQPFHETPVLVLIDTVNSCGVNWASSNDSTIYPMQRAVFRLIRVEGADVAVEVDFGKRVVTRKQANECTGRDLRSQRIPASMIPATTRYRIFYRFDGRRLVASPESTGATQMVHDAESAERK
jgi:hypothetical protein